MPELAIIVPTRGRPENVRKVISAWDFTNAWDHADLVLVADADDPEIGGYRLLQQELDHPDTGQSLVTLVEIPAWLPMVYKLDAAARELAERYWAIGFAGDDHLPRTIGWAKRYLDVLHEMGTGMVYSDDGYQGSNLSTEWAVTSDTVRELGRMVPAPVEHMYCDNAMMALFTAVGALRHLPEIRIEHMHPVAGKAATDAQYQRVNHRSQFRRDRAAYERWERLEMPAQAALVRQLRAGRPDEKNPKPARSPRRPTRGRISAMRPPRFFKRVQGATPEDILITLADFAAQVPADQEIVELGVFQGRSALQLAWGARQGNGAHVTGIDAWDLPGNTYGPPFTDPGSQRWAKHWVQSLGYSKGITLIQAFAAEVGADWRNWNGRPVGLLFVDDDHSAEGARRAIESWAPHLAEGAIVAVDDYEHPDWPGVAEAVDALVDEGVLEPVELFHDRLAVTRLVEKAFPTVPCDDECDTPADQPHDAHLVRTRTGIVTAITSEGISPSPYPAAEGQAADDPQQRAVTVDLGEPSYVVDSDVSTVPPSIDRDREVVHAGELEDVTNGTPVEELNTVQLRALAKSRGIVLGARKDKRAEMLAALRDGR
jgi:predicted O-methyltransferase YrrM